MSLLRKLPRVGAALAVLAAVAVGSAAIAGAASNGSSSSSRSSNSAQAPQGDRPPAGVPGNGGPGQHKPETPLTGDTAANVKKAVLAKVSGGTIIRVETDTDHGSPYEAHVRKSDGSEVEVLVNKQFQVTAVNDFGPGR
jgi:hypothetical protein